MPQAPPLQLGVPFVASHVAPQAEQFAGSVPRLASQPLPFDPSQFANPASHPAMPHWPASQLTVPFGAVQTLAQAPQCVGSLAMLASQPFSRLASQSSKPGTQVIPHSPPVQLGTPFVPLQAMMQAPQWSESELVSTSQPFATLPSQSSNPALQAIAHVPPLQLAVPFVASQASAQPPQWSGSALVSTSQPFAALPSQSSNPALQAIAQVPPLQLAVPFVASQASAQPPQWSVSVSVLTSQPLAASPSQSP
jgi:hypothetical protein